jgi:hypothetical protein
MIVDYMEWTEFVNVVAQVRRVGDVLEIGIGYIHRVMKRGSERGSERGSVAIGMWWEFMRRVILSWLGVIQLVGVVAH